jgi:hypothetical protein
LVEAAEDEPDQYMLNGVCEGNEQASQDAANLGQ